VLSARGLCDELITRPEESNRLWRVVVCDKDTSKTWRLMPATGLWKIQTQRVETPGKQTRNNYYSLSSRTHYLVPWVCLRATRSLRVWRPSYWLLLSAPDDSKTWNITF
jgi:hypothetical protein